MKIWSNLQLLVFLVGNVTYLPRLSSDSNNTNMYGFFLQNRKNNKTLFIEFFGVVRWSYFL